MKLYSGDPLKSRSKNKEKAPLSCSVETADKPFRLRRKRRYSFFLLRLLFFIFITGVFSTLGVLLWFAKDFPSFDVLMKTSRKPSVIIQSKDHKNLASYGELYADFVRVEDLPPHVTNALIAVEDRRFYQHFGVDFLGLLRALYTNMRAGRVQQGGSTLTQQLAKNILFSQGTYSVFDRSLKRKVQEAFLAFWLESRFSKNEILTLYLNRVYFGAGTFGIDAASKRYFKKTAQELSVFESAVIAGLLRAPSRYSPSSNPSRAMERAMVVLKTMEEEGFIKDHKAYEASGIEQLSQGVVQQQTRERYFSDWVYESIPDLLGPLQQDVVVETTFDPAIQEIALRVIQKLMASMAKELKVSEVAFVAMTPQGAVKAMVGGMNYAASQWNRVTQAIRQPGSAFKPFVYLAALEHGVSPDDMIEDTPVSFSKWSPKNFKWRSRGEISVREALTHSVNAVSIRLTDRVGPKRVAGVASRLGITSEMNYDLSLSLGTCSTTLLELTTAYATFANDGRSVWAHGIKNIHSKDKQVLYERFDRETEKIIQDTNLQDMLDMLRSVIENGTGRACNVSPSIHGKTGSNGDRDAWFFGFNVDEIDARELVIGVWVGNDHNQPMNKKSVGGRLPARIAAAFYKEFFAYFDKLPPSVQAAPSAPAPMQSRDGEDEESEELLSTASTKQSQALDSLLDGVEGDELSDIENDPLSRELNEDSY